MTNPQTSSESTLSNSWLELDTARLRSNIEVLQDASRPAKVVGVVKANAYGHGAVAVANILLQSGVERLAVATVQEGITLRDAGFDVPIFVLAAPLPKFLDLYRTYNLELTIPSIESAQFVADSIDAESGGVDCHIKIDTGMGRIGCQPDHVRDIVAILSSNPGVRIRSLWTHLARSTDADGIYSGEQVDRFVDAVKNLPNIENIALHVASSYALNTSRRSISVWSGDTWTRIGVALYGMMDQRGLEDTLDLEPVLRWTSELVQIKRVAQGSPISYGGRWVAQRPSLIGTVSVGYADGYSRQMENRAEVGIRGERFPVVGAICMDMIMVDLGSLEDQQRFNIGDEVVLMGRGGPSVFELADWAKTISYEITTSITARVGRTVI
ncbi:MAG: alanine racemase [Rhodothermales bacterium]|nr:alanine racemase [Rhodothermales bacterium]